MIVLRAGHNLAILKKKELSARRRVKYMPYSIKVYETMRGKRPFQQWLDDLPGMKIRVRMELRIDRLTMGNLGQCKALNAGLYELKIDMGPGYRIYFGKIGQQIILLLCAGDKKSQKTDIIKAREYLKDYKMRVQ